MLAEKESWMREALKEAELAGRAGDVPVGCVIVGPSGLIARAHNRREVDRDPCAHAEVLAIREAARALDRWRLSETTLYVTLEPCVMCAGALVLARVPRLVYGTDDPKAGAIDTFFGIGRDERLNHEIEVESGLLADECAALLKAFFASRR